MQKKEFSMDLAGKKLTAEFNDLADQTNGSVFLRYGDTTILATAVMSKRAKYEYDYFPLTVDYEEKFYAVGQILGSKFMRREGKPSDEAILSGRIVDRTIRPLFDHHIRHEVQVVITVLSMNEHDPDVLGVIAASLALGTSDIPWKGPVSAVRIGKKVGKDAFETNPAYEYRKGEDMELDLVACGKDGNINMIEVGAKEMTEDALSKALTFASSEIEKIQDFQKKVIAEVNKKKVVIPAPELKKEIKKLFAENIEPKMDKTVFSKMPGWANIEALKEEWEKLFLEKFPEEEENMFLALNHFDNTLDDMLHKEALENDRRADGRGMDDVRPLFAKAGGVSSILHGSGIFYRGGTHILSVLTLGSPGDSQTIDGMEVQADKRYMHHYNFPPFSSGEVGRMGGTNRRAIGHGALAEKALVPVLPSQEKFPYTIRIVSESMASNGSTSMGSVCGSTIALLDAGVPISAPVAGIASGLMMESHKKYKVLTDIQGPEDHHGDMDFKVAGTRKGVTAVQMDVKVEGIPLQILSEAFEKAKMARFKILDVIEKEIKEPRKEISPNAPKIILVKIKPEQIGMVIGAGGKVINEIKEYTGAEIDIEDNGNVYITGKNGSAEKAAEIVAEMTKEFNRGDKAIGEVVKITEFGAFVNLGGKTEGLVHVSEMATFRIDRIGDYLKVGDKVPIVVKDIDERGRLKLSIKDSDPTFLKRKEVPKK